MTKKTDTPAIRFKGFSDTWEQRKLGEILIEHNIRTSDFENNPLYSLTIESGITPKTERYERSSLVTKTEDLFKVVKPNEFVTNPMNLRFGALGYNTNPFDISVSGYYDVFSIDNDKCSGFWNSYFKTPIAMKIFDNAATGSLIEKRRVKYSTLQQLDFYMPKMLEEKVLIGRYMDFLDNLITLHQRKCKIRNLRCPKSTAITWEQRKLSEIATMHARIGWQNLRTSEFLDNGDYMLITGTDFMDGAVNFDTCHYVERERYEQDKHIQIRNGSILITKDGTLGKVAYIQGLTMPATLNAGVFNVEIRDEKEVDNRYLFQYLKAPFLMDYVDKKATGGTIKHLNQNILVDFPVVLPQKDEQAKIGEYFLGIDNLITLHQRKPDCYQFKLDNERITKSTSLFSSS